MTQYKGRPYLPSLFKTSTHEDRGYQTRQQQKNNKSPTIHGIYVIKSSCFTIFLGKQIIRSFVENRGRSPFQSLRDKLHGQTNNRWVKDVVPLWSKKNEVKYDGPLG